MAPVILKSSLPINASESDTELHGVILWSKTISGQIKSIFFLIHRTHIPSKSSFWLDILQIRPTIIY